MKRRSYCREENQDIDRQDLQSDAIQNRIQSFMESRGFPKMWEDGEYERYFELIFGPDREKQRAYLRGILALDKASLSVGNRVLGALVASKLAPAIFTTNFDDVVESAVADGGGQALVPFHLEGSHNILSAYKNEEFPIYCKLHGDFRYESIKNLSEDLEAQNQDLAAGLPTACNRFGLILCGYSGRDKSVMDLLHSVLDTTNPYPHGIYWTCLKGSTSAPSVEAFMEAARRRNVDAHVVFIETYDALMLRLWRNTPNKDAMLDKGASYAGTATEQKFTFVAEVLALLSDIRPFQISTKMGRAKSFRDWRGVLRWWLAKRTLSRQPTPAQITNWYEFVASNFIYRGVWGVGSALGFSLT
ncbi:hypothetical protein ABIE89_000438 [Bradyrhizobium niftali]|uniref:SIR2 family protein n=1 Tax=Bradyrhizobium niftali TaxID=2560055 RepID=UPI003833D229